MSTKEIKDKEALSKVLFYVSFITGQTPSDILGRLKTPEVALARHLLYYYARRKGISLPTIGRFVSKHHSSVIHGISNINSFISAKDFDATHVVEQLDELLLGDKDRGDWFVSSGTL